MAGHAVAIVALCAGHVGGNARRCGSNGHHATGQHSKAAKKGSEGAKTLHAAMMRH